MEFDPANDPKIKGDPYKTLFVSRIAYDVTEVAPRGRVRLRVNPPPTPTPTPTPDQVAIKKEFEQYGPIKRIRLVYVRVRVRVRVRVIGLG